jgi:molybdopterin-dependent oxidoreductase alpha subunit
MATARKLGPGLEGKPYEAPTGGWGSVRSLARSLGREYVPFTGTRVLLKQNKVDGFMCVSCAWAKPADPRVFEFCENGAKATTWEITHKRATPDFFAQHTVADLEKWDDHQLEAAGRLTHPMRWDRETDKYVPVEWATAFEEIGRELRALDPERAVFYTSGRASLETAFMYGLFARAYGNNNLPDSSNMCHETTSVALPESIGVPVGTCTLDDFAHTDCIFFFGQNVGTSSPRMLHQLQEAVKRGVPIVTFNPLRERGLVEFVNPQSPAEMLIKSPTQITSQYHQVKTGGDTAAMMGVAKVLLDLDEEASRADPRPWFHQPAHPWFQRIQVCCEGYQLAADRTALRVDARRAGGRGSRLCPREIGDVHLRNGADPAQKGCRDRANHGQPRLDARQHRPSRRRYLSSSRPLQRAGTANRRHHRAPRKGAV